jgi:vWA-MoxR associated protein C-terminal domain
VSLKSALSSFSSKQLKDLVAEILKCPSMKEEAKRTALVNALKISALQRFTDPARDVQAIIELALICRSHDEFFDALANIEEATYTVLIARNKCDRILLCIQARQAVTSAPVTRGKLRKFYLLSVSNSPLVPSDGDLDEWLESLADMADRDTCGFSRLEEFIARVYRDSKSPEAGEWLESLTPQKREDIRVFLDAEKKFATQPKPYLAIMISTIRLKPDEQPCIEAWLSNGGENPPHWIVPCEPKEEAVRDKCLALLSEARARVGLNLSVEFLVPNEQLRMAPETWEIVHPFSPASTLGHDHTVVMRWRERVRETELTANWLNRASAIQDRIQSGLTPMVLWASLKDYDYFSLRDKLVKKEPGDCIAFEFVPQKNAAVTADNLLLAAMVGGAPFLYIPESVPHDWNALKKDLGDLALLGLEEIPDGLKKMRVKARSKLADCGTLIWDDPNHLPRPARLAPAGQQTP